MRGKRAALLALTLALAVTGCSAAMEKRALEQELAIAQLAQAQTELTEDIRDNRYANESLENNARIVISALVCSLNPEIPDLTVDVEFF